MYPYVAFLWNACNAVESAAAGHLTTLFRSNRPEWEPHTGRSGLVVFHDKPQGRAFSAYPLFDQAGIILGTLFPSNMERWSLTWQADFGCELTSALIRTRGELLVHEYWGRYVAFFSNAEGTSHYVIRDCSGNIPCYTTRCCGIDVVFSDIRDLDCLPLTRLSLNSRYLIGFIFEAEFSNRESALNEVTEILAGDCFEITSHGKRVHSIWDPRLIAGENAENDFDEASAAIRTIAQQCITAWASLYDRAILQLSGGLDSSAVLGCLRGLRTPEQLVCTHFFTAGQGEDERQFARIAASAAQAQLVELELYPANVKLDERVEKLPRAPKPSVNLTFAMINLSSRNQVPTMFNAEAVWDGQGGDQLFFSSSQTLTAADHLFLHGFKSGIGRSIHDDVRRSGRSYFSVLHSALKLGLMRGAWHPQEMTHRTPAFLHPQHDTRFLRDYAWQPWLSASSHLPPGKRLQILSIATVLNRHRPLPGLEFASSLHPLLSQPIMEACLRVPTYTLGAGGIDRALERNAFRSCVPASIISRCNKGATTSGVMGIIRRSDKFIQELLLDGILVRERIISRSALEPYFAGHRPLPPDYIWPLVSCIAAEVWARQWAGRNWQFGTPVADQ